MTADSAAHDAVTQPAPLLDVPEDQAWRRAADFAADLSRRRSVREFSDRPIPWGVLEEAVGAAATAPSGANVQPWRFVIVTDPQVRRRLRVAAEAEEQEFYGRRASQEWLDALEPIGADWPSLSWRPLPP